MSNSFNISFVPEIAAVGALVSTVDTVVDAIRATDVPNIQTNIDANETKIDTVDTVVDAIKVKTDAMPQNVRGGLASTYLETDSDGATSLFNITGHGKLVYINFRCKNAGDTVTLYLKIDGFEPDEVSHTGDTDWQNIVISDSKAASSNILFLPTPLLVTGCFLLNLDFATELRVAIRRSAGANDLVCGKCSVSVDSF